MNLEFIIATIRSGEGRIRPIIDFYRKSHTEAELIPYLNDLELRSTIIYILSELSNIDSKVVSCIEELLKGGAIKESDEAWAQDIIHNNRMN